MNVKIDDSVLAAKLRAAIQGSPEVRQEALKIMTTRVMQAVVGYAPRDTNAYANAWAQASTQAGLGEFPMPPLNPKSKLNRKAEWYIEGVRYWQQIVDSNAAKQRTGRWADDARGKLIQAQALLTAFYAKNEGRILAPPVTGSEGSHTIKAEVINEGGIGEFIQVADRTYYRLTNYEKHARGVEARTHLMQNAREPFRALGLTGGIRTTYIQRIALVSGLATKLTPGR